MPTTEPVTSRPVPPSTPSPLQDPVEPGEHQQHADADHRAGHGVPERGDLRRRPRQPAAADPQRVTDEQRERHAGQRRRCSATVEAVGEVLARTAGPRAGGPSPRASSTAQPTSRADRQQERPRPARAGRRRSRQQPAARSRAARARARCPGPLLGEPGPAAHQPLAGQHGDREQQHQRRQLQPRSRSRRSPSRPCRRRPRRSARRSTARSRSRSAPPSSPAPARPRARAGPAAADPEDARPRPAPSVRAASYVDGRLLGERRPGHQVDVGVEGQRHHHDAAPAACAPTAATPVAEERRAATRCTGPAASNVERKTKPRMYAGIASGSTSSQTKHVAQRERVRRHQPGQPAADRPACRARPRPSAAAW